MKLLMPFVLATLLFGCTTSEQEKNNQLTKVETGNISQFLQHKTTFAWYPVESKSYIPEDINENILKDDTERAIIKVMQDKGYSFVENVQQANFLISYGLAAESELSDKQIFDKVGTVVGLAAEDIDQDKFQKGSILIAFYKPYGVHPEWQVMAQGIAEKDKSQQERKTSINAVIFSLLNHVPAKTDNLVTK